MKKKKGFTIVELLVALVILGILFTIGLVSYRSINMSVRQRQYENVIKRIEAASLKYASETNAKVFTVKMIIEKGLLLADGNSNTIYSPVDKTDLGCYIINMIDGKAVFNRNSTGDCSDLNEVENLDFQLRYVVSGSCSGNPRVWTNTNKVLCITSNTKDVSGIEEVYWSTPLAPDKIISSKTYEVEVEEDSYVYEVYKARVKYNDGKNYLAKAEVRIDKENPTCSFTASSDKLFLSSKDKYSGVKDRKIIKDDVTINFNSTNMAIGNFDGEVTDLAGNITTCSAEVQNTIISKYDIQTQACEQYNLYDCKKAATKIVECPKGYSDTGSKCRKLIGDAKVTMVCPSGYKPSKDRDDCYDKQPFNTDGSALWWCLPPYKKIDDACYHFKSKVPKYSCSSGTLSNKKCYSYEKYISVQYVCSEGTLEDKTCYKYDQMSCDSWKIVTTKKDNYDFFSVVTSDGACSTTPEIVCDVDNVGNSYISECTPSEYTCNEGTKIDNNYCLINK